MNPFIPWAIFVALQVLVRRAQTKSNILCQHPSTPSILSNQQHADPPYRCCRMSSGPAASISTTSSDIWIDARALDSMHFLMSTLSKIETSKPLARVLKALIDQEIAEGEAVTQDRVIGLVNFPLAHLNTSSHHDLSDVSNNSIPA